MATLTQEKCAASKIKPASPEEIAELKPQIPEWNFTEVNGISCLERTFKFDNFKQALDFTNQVGELAESEGHHPALLTEWGKVTVSWWTHAISDLHRNDFIMAAKSDRLITG